MSVFSENLKIVRSKSGLIQQEIADLVGVTASTWSNYEVGKSEPNIDTIVKIASVLNVSADTLLSRDIGTIVENLIEGNPILKKGGAKTGKKGNEIGNPNGNLTLREPPLTYSTERMPKVISTDLTGVENIIFVPIKARAGYLNGYADTEFIQTLPTCRLPGLTNGTFRMFEIEGHSMIPTFNESDRLVGRFVDNFNEIRDNRVYCILTKRDGIVVKRVINRLTQDGKLILNSDNQRHAGEYPPIILNPEDVLEIWYGVMYISRQMREPSDLYTRVTDLESRLTLWEQGQRKLGK